MELNKKFLIDALGWGFLLWLFGYVLSIILFIVVPPSMIGWIITPIATGIALWVLIKKIKSTSLQYYLFIGIVWTVLAVVLDYIFIVKMFKPADGYYKIDVYIYYGLTFILPILIGLRKQNERFKERIG